MTHEAGEPIGTEDDGPAAEGLLVEVRDGDRGLYRITTETSLYLLDLDRRAILRMGGAVRNTHIADDGAIVWSYFYDWDYQWLPLLRLVHCAIGDRLHVMFDYGNGPQPLRSTLVARIERTEPP